MAYTGHYTEHFAKPNDDGSNSCWNHPYAQPDLWSIWGIPSCSCCLSEFTSHDEGVDYCKVDNQTDPTQHSMVSLAVPDEDQTQDPQI